MKEVFIHKEDLPKSCFKCPFVDFDTDLPNIFCDVTCKVLNDTGEEDIEEGRHANCPLKVLKNKSISEWAKEVHENAKAHGWWDNPRQTGELLMLVVSEASEAFEEVRNGHAMTETYYSANGKMEGIPSELADIVIRVMDLCEFYGINLEAAIAEKHAYNKTRPFRHGGKKY